MDGRRARVGERERKGKGRRGEEKPKKGRKTRGKRKGKGRKKQKGRGLGKGKGREKKGKWKGKGNGRGRYEGKGKERVRVKVEREKEEGNGKERGRGWEAGAGCGWQGEELDGRILVGAPCCYSGPGCGESFDRLVYAGVGQAVDLVLQKLSDEVLTVCVAGGSSEDLLEVTDPCVVWEPCVRPNLKGVGYGECLPV